MVLGPKFGNVFCKLGMELLCIFKRLECVSGAIQSGAV